MCSLVMYLNCFSLKPCSFLLRYVCVYSIDGKFDSWKIWLLIVSTNLDGFSLVNHAWAIHQIRQAFSLYSNTTIMFDQVHTLLPQAICGFTTYFAVKCIQVKQWRS